MKVVLEPRNQELWDSTAQELQQLHALFISKGHSKGQADHCINEIQARSRQIAENNPESYNTTVHELIEYFMGEHHLIDVEKEIPPQHQNSFGHVW